MQTDTTKVEDRHDFAISIHGNQIILDLGNVETGSENRYQSILKSLDRLIERETPVEASSMGLWDQVKFLRDNAIVAVYIPINLEAITKKQDELVSLTSVQLDGDIKYVYVGGESADNQSLLMEIHQKLVLLYMKRWQNQVIETGIKIGIVLRTIRIIQGISTATGIITYIIGSSVQTSSSVFSLIPLAFSILLELVKRQLSLDPKPNGSIVIV